MIPLRSLLLCCVATFLCLGAGCADVLVTGPEIQSEKIASESFDSSIALCDLDWVRRHLEAYPQLLKKETGPGHPSIMQWG